MVVTTVSFYSLLCLTVLSVIVRVRSFGFSIINKLLGTVKLGFFYQITHLSFQSKLYKMQQAELGPRVGWERGGTSHFNRPLFIKFSVCLRDVCIKLLEHN